MPGPAGPADELDRQDAVAAEIEEVVVDGDAVDAEDLGEQAGRASPPARRERRPAGAGLEDGGGQRGPVDLAVRA